MGRGDFPIRTLIVDDDPQVRRVLRRILEGDKRFEVAGEAADGREAVAQVAAQNPDAVILDLAMPDHDGLETIPEILQSSPGCKIVVLSSMVFGELPQKAVEAGAHAVLSKNTPPRKLLKALSEAVASDE